MRARPLFTKIRKGCQIFSARLFARLSARLSARLPALLCIFLASEARAQENTDSKARLNPNNCYDVGLMFGTLIPRSDGLSDLVPGWGLRGSLPTDKGVFELSGFSGIGHGTIYRTAALDYRIDFPVDTISAHILLGLHADQYYEPDYGVSNNFGGGWHYGGGITIPAFGPTFLRFEFRHRFSPGQVLEVTASVVYRIPRNSSN